MNKFVRSFVNTSTIIIKENYWITVQLIFWSNHDHFGKCLFYFNTFFIQTNIQILFGYFQNIENISNIN